MIKKSLYFFAKYNNIIFIKNILIIFFYLYKLEFYKIKIII